jgi:hypothetical protein
MSETAPQDDSENPEPTVPARVLSPWTLLWVPFAAALTPILILLIPTLFAKGATDSFLDTKVLTHLWGNVAKTWGLGITILGGEILLFRSQNNAFLPFIRFFGWLYLLAGPFWGILKISGKISYFIMCLSESPVILVVMPVVLISLLWFTGFLTSKIGPLFPFLPVFALISLLLISIVVITDFSRVQTPPPSAARNTLKSSQTSGLRRDRKNPGSEMNIETNPGSSALTTTRTQTTP